MSVTLSQIWALESKVVVLALQRVGIWAMEDLPTVVGTNRQYLANYYAIRDELLLTEVLWTKLSSFKMLTGLPIEDNKLVPFLDQVARKTLETKIDSKVASCVDSVVAAAPPRWRCVYHLLKYTLQNLAVLLMLHPPSEKSCSTTELDVTAGSYFGEKLRLICANVPHQDATFTSLAQIIATRIRSPYTYHPKKDLYYRFRQAWLLVLKHDDDFRMAAWMATSMHHLEPEKKPEGWEKASNFVAEFMKALIKSFVEPGTGSDGTKVANVLGCITWLKITHLEGLPKAPIKHIEPLVRAVYENREMSEATIIRSVMDMV